MVGASKAEGMHYLKQTLPCAADQQEGRYSSSSRCCTHYIAAHTTSLHLTQRTQQTCVLTA
jgi:hypothetical protein